MSTLQEIIAGLATAVIIWMAVFWSMQGTKAEKYVNGLKKFVEDGAKTVAQAPLRAPIIPVMNKDGKMERFGIMTAMQGGSPFANAYASEDERFRSHTGGNKEVNNWERDFHEAVKKGDRRKLQTLADKIPDSKFDTYQKILGEMHIQIKNKDELSKLLKGDTVDGKKLDDNRLKEFSTKIAQDNSIRQNNNIQVKIDEAKNQEQSSNPGSKVSAAWKDMGEKLQTAKDGTDQNKKDDAESAFTNLKSALSVQIGAGDLDPTNGLNETKMKELKRNYQNIKNNAQAKKAMEEVIREQVKKANPNITDADLNKLVQEIMS